MVVSEPWTPRLHLQERAGRCRLVLDGVTDGQGATLQEAADELVGRVLTIVAAVRRAGYRHPAELGPPDLRLFAFLYELGDIVARGGDIRQRLFGTPDEPDLAA
jgi:hypothetical protein